MSKRRQIQIPPDFPKRDPPKRKLVFVDPDDSQAAFWWPALVVPMNELKQFKSSIEGAVFEPSEHEYLVCYFEDGSYSVVSEADTVPFCPYKPPYTTYCLSLDCEKFQTDKAVQLATMYWEQGVVPQVFSWLKNEPEEDRSSVPTFPLKELLDEFRKRRSEAISRVKKLKETPPEEEAEKKTETMVEAVDKMEIDEQNQTIKDNEVKQEVPQEAPVERAMSNPVTEDEPEPREENATGIEPQVEVTQKDPVPPVSEVKEEQGILNEPKSLPPLAPSERKPSSQRTTSDPTEAPSSTATSETKRRTSQMDVHSLINESTPPRNDVQQ